MGSCNKSRSRAPPLKSNLGSHVDSLRPACANLNPSRHASGQAGEPKAKQTFKYSPGGPDLDSENRFLNREMDLLNQRKNVLCIALNTNQHALNRKRDLLNIPTNLENKTDGCP